MNIVFSTGTFYPLFNGVISYVTDAAAQLSKRGHRVLVLTPRPEKSANVDISSYPFEIYFLPSLPLKIYPHLRITPPAVPMILSKIRLFKADIVHVNDPMPISIDAIAAAKILKIPTVITFHTFFLDPDMLRTVKWGRVVNLFTDPLSRLNAFYHNLANVVICPSKSAKSELEHYGLKKPGRVITNGIDLSKVVSLTMSQKREKRRKLGIGANAFVGIYSGRLAIDKRVDVLFEIWEKVVADIPGAVLLIVGSGPEEESLRLAAEEKFPKGNIKFLGAVDRKKLFSEGIYAVADIFVTASKIENQSMAMIEALAFGLPIVAVNMRGNSELVDKIDGILVDPDNQNDFTSAVVTLAQFPRRRLNLSKGAQAKAKLFSLESSVNKLEKVYEEIIALKR